MVTMYYNIETDWPISISQIDEYIPLEYNPTLCPYLESREGYRDRNVYEQDSNIWIN